MVKVMILNNGRVCIVKTGRDFGKLCVVVSTPKNNMVEVQGPDLKKRKINILHLWPTEKLGNVKSIDI